jgi:hypothetical protein
MNARILRCLLALMLAAGALWPAAAASAARADLAAKRVLVLSPYSYGRPGLDVYIHQYMATLTAQGMSAENITVEYLNLNRARLPAARAHARARLLLDYEAAPVDLIVTLQQTGLNYLFSDLPALSPGAPILAINGTLAPGVGEGRVVLQQAISSDFDGTIARALDLFPNTGRVLLATGAAPADLAVQRVVERVALRWKNRLAFEYTDKMTLAEIEHRVRTLPPDAIILAGSINQDVAGAPHAPLEVAAHLGRIANRPLFCVNSVGVGDGCIGGSVQHVERGAESAAMLSIDLITRST